MIALHWYLSCPVRFLFACLCNSFLCSLFHSSTRSILFSNLLDQYSSPIYYMVLDALSQVGMRFVGFSFSLELLLHFLQQVGKDLPPSSVTFCNYCSFRAAYWIGQRSRTMTMPHCGWTGGKPGSCQVDCQWFLSPHVAECTAGQFMYPSVSASLPWLRWNLHI